MNVYSSAVMESGLTQGGGAKPGRWKWGPLRQTHVRLYYMISHHFSGEFFPQIFWEGGGDAICKYGGGGMMLVANATSGQWMREHESRFYRSVTGIVSPSV
jgi:hypothetical protein